MSFLRIYSWRMRKSLIKKSPFGDFFICKVYFFTKALTILFSLDFLLAAVFL